MENKSNTKEFPLTRAEINSVFPDSISRVWKFVKNDSHLLEVLVKVELLKTASKFLPAMNNKDDQQSFKLVCMEEINGNEYRQIMYSLVLTNTYNLNFKFVLYPITLTESTLVLLEISNNVIENAQILKESAKSILAEIKTYLKKYPIYISECESVVINCSAEKIWDYITSETRHDKFVAKSPRERNPKKVGDVFRYYWDNKEVGYAEIKKLDKETDKKQMNFSLILHNKDSSSVICEIKFVFLVLKDDCVFLSYHHDFKRQVKQRELSQLTKTKKTFLKAIKNYFSNK